MYVCRILGVEVEVHSILGFVDNTASKNAKAISLLSKSGGVDIIFWPGAKNVFPQVAWKLRIMGSGPRALVCTLN